MQIATLLQLVQRDEYVSTFAAMIDIRKAYNSVYRPALWNRLWDLGEHMEVHLLLLPR